MSGTTRSEGRSGRLPVLPPRPGALVDDPEGRFRTARKRVLESPALSARDRLAIAEGLRGLPDDDPIWSVLLAVLSGSSDTTESRRLVEQTRKEWRREMQQTLTTHSRQQTRKVAAVLRFRVIALMTALTGVIALLAFVAGATVA